MFSNWPELVPPQRVKRDCHFSNLTTYSLVKLPGLGVQIGKRYYFLKSKFIEYLENQSFKEKSIKNVDLK